MYIVGIALGILIGVISGLVVLFLFKTGMRALKPIDILLLVPEFLAIPTFWLGGPWLTTSLLEIVDLNDILPSYILSLTFTFVLIIIIPLFRLVIVLGNEVGRRGVGDDVW